jgi:hypothetical protein
MVRTCICSSLSAEACGVDIILAVFCTKSEQAFTLYLFFNLVKIEPSHKKIFLIYNSVRKVFK